MQRGIYDELLERLAEKVAKIAVGPGPDGVTIGPLIDDRAVEKAEEHVQDALGHGATPVTGGQRLEDGEFAGGNFYAPTVLDGITDDMLIYREETFGPVAGLTPFDNEADAISCERHRLRPRGVLPHPRLRAPAAGRREARVRHRRRQHGHHLGRQRRRSAA